MTASQKNIAYKMKFRLNPSRKPCDCGQRATIYRSSAFMCARCAYLESRAVRDEFLGRMRCNDTTKKTDAVCHTERHEQKWQRAAGEWENTTGPGWGTLAVLEAALARIKTDFATENFQLPTCNPQHHE